MIKDKDGLKPGWNRSQRIPYGTLAWKQSYGRRNIIEKSNAMLKDKGGLNAGGAGLSVSPLTTEATVAAIPARKPDSGE